MEVSLGFFDSPENILIRRFSLNYDFLGEETIGINDLSACNLDGLLLPQDGFNQDILDTLKEELNFFPILKGNNLSLNYSEFKNLNPLIAISKLAELNRPWVLKNNLLLIENLFETVGKFKSIIHKEREVFFKEFWHLLKNNLGALDMVLYFNDLENGKNKIIGRKVSGKKYPEISELADTDQKILENLKGPSGTIIFYKDKREFFIKMEVLGSPVLVIGRCFDLTPLQKSLLKSLFKGLE